jgi:hypothetical protein
MTAIILTAILAGSLGFAIGKLSKFAARVEGDFAAWRDRITAASLQPRNEVAP